MSRPLLPIVCDGPGCGKQKQQANHWWSVEVVTSKGRLSRMTVFPGTVATPDNTVAPLYDFCGQDCAVKFLSEQMGKVTS